LRCWLFIASAGVNVASELFGIIFTIGSEAIIMPRLAVNHDLDISIVDSDDVTITVLNCTVASNYVAAARDNACNNNGGRSGGTGGNNNGGRSRGRGGNNGSETSWQQKEEAKRDGGNGGDRHRRIKGLIARYRPDQPRITLFLFPLAGQESPRPLARRPTYVDAV
jgi:hypothetical protein